MIILAVFDQLTKYIARSSLASGDIELIPGVLELHLLYNTGAAFSILTGKTALFYVVTPVLCAIILYFFFRLPFEKKYLGLSFCLSTLTAGAVGNYIDRLAAGQVTDFIYFSLINFPIFNVADIYVTLSVVFLLIILLFGLSEDEIAAWIKKKNV